MEVVNTISTGMVASIAAQILCSSPESLKYVAESPTCGYRVPGTQRTYQEEELAEIARTAWALVSEVEKQQPRKEPLDGTDL